MYELTNQSVADYITGDSRTFRAKMVFANGTVITDDIVSVNVTHSSSDTDLKPGAVISNGITAEILGVASDITGQTFQLYFYAVNLFGELPEELIPIGNYTVTSCKISDIKATVEAKDKLYKAEGTYIPSVSLPTTSAMVEADICNNLGIERGSEDGLSAPVEFIPEGATMRDMLGYCAGLDGGKFAVLDRYGKLVHRFYADSGYTVTPERSDEPETEQSDITITQVICNADGTEFEEHTSMARSVSFENPYMTSELFSAVADNWIGFGYRPLSVNYRLGDPRIDIWDMITVKKTDGTAFAIPVMNITFSYDGGISSAISATGTVSKTGNSDGPVTRNIKKIVEESKTATEKKLTSAFQTSIDYINGVNGGYVYTEYNADGQPTATYYSDNIDITAATNVLKINNRGILGTSGGKDGVYNLAIDTQGRINASQIVTGILSTVTIQSLNYSAVAGTKINLEDGTFTFAGGKLKFDGNVLSVDGKITAASGTIGGFEIGAAELKSSGGGYTAVLSCYDNTDPKSRVLHCYQGTDTANDTFRILRDGTVQLIKSQMIVGPTSLSNSLAVQAGHINFYYSSARVGQLGIASVNGNFRPTFDNPLGVNGHVVMSSLGQYLYGGGKVLIGASTSGNIVIGNSEQTGDVNIYGGKGYVINLMATSAEGTTTKAAYAYTKGIYLPNTRAIVGLSSDSAECNLLYMSSGNNVILGSTSQPGNVHIYTASGNDIKFNVDTTTVAYVDYTGLTAKSISTTGAITAAGATINGVATVNGLTVNGGATAYSLTTTYGVTCASLTTSGNVALDNNKYVTAKNTSGTAYNILGINSSGHAAFGSSSLAGNAYVMCKDGYYVNLRVGSVNVAAISSSGLLMPNDMMIMCGTASKHVNAIRLKTTEIGVGYASIPLKLVGSAVTTNGSAVTSDRRLKTDINPLGDKYTKLIDKLSAVNYRYTTHRSNVVNCGFIAQDVLTALSEVGLTADEFGGFVDVYGDGREFALDYTQFVPILWEQIKTLKAKIKTLEEANL